MNPGKRANPLSGTCRIEYWSWGSTRPGPGGSDREYPGIESQAHVIECSVEIDGLDIQSGLEG